MAKVIFTGYEFEPAANRIKMLGVTDAIPDFSMANVQVITNLTTGQVICIPQLPAKRPLSWDGTYLTLLFDVTGMNSADELQVILNDWAIPDTNTLKIIVPETVQVSGAVAMLEPVEIVPFSWVQTVHVDNFPAVGATVHVDNFPAQEGLTNQELRAAPVPVSGAVQVNAGENLNTSELAKETTLVAMAGKDFATQTTLAAILNVLQQQQAFEETIWKDENGVFFVRRTVEEAGVFSTVYLLPSGASYTPVGAVTLATSNSDMEFRNIDYRATAGGTGYSVDDYIIRTDLWNLSTTPPTLTATLWFNKTTGQVLGTAPVQADLSGAGTVTAITASSLPLPVGAATEATLLAAAASLEAMNTNPHEVMVLNFPGAAIGEKKYSTGGYYPNVPTGTPRDFFLTVGDITSVGFLAKLGVENQKVLFTVYENPSVAGGTSVPVLNMDRNDPSVSVVTARTGVSVSSVGTVVCQPTMIPADTAPYLMDPALEKVTLKANTTYLVRAAALANGANISVTLFLSEGVA